MLVPAISRGGVQYIGSTLLSTFDKQKSGGTMPTGSYTATEDCWACGYIEGDGGSLAAKIYVDTTQVIFTSSAMRFPFCFPVKKGQVVSNVAYGERYYIQFYSMAD